MRRSLLLTGLLCLLIFPTDLGGGERHGRPARPLSRIDEP